MSGDEINGVQVVFVHMCDDFFLGLVQGRAILVIEKQVLALKAFKTQLVQRVGRVGDKLTKKNILV